MKLTTESKKQTTMVRRSTRLAKQSKRNAVVTKRIAKCPKPMPRKKKVEAVFNNPKALVNAPPNKRRPNLGNDDFNTPAVAWLLAEKILKIKGKKVWCPFYNDGNLTCPYENRIHHKRDFFAYEPDQYDCVVDNPPYSIKKNVIQKLQENGKPFALLIPLETIIRRYFVETDLQDFTIIIPKTPYKFKGKEKTISVNTAWFCWGFKLGNQVIWE